MILNMVCLPKYLVFKLGILLLVTLPLTAQHQAELWYFGIRCGVDFRSLPPRALQDSRMFLLEGGASYSHPETGKLLFYTDGFQVWRRDHAFMQSSSPVLSEDPRDWPTSYSTSQGALVVPHPGNDELFYVFNPGNLTNGQSQHSANVRRLYEELSYSLIDMSKRGGLGEIVDHKALTPGIHMTEKLSGTASCGADEFGYWVLTTEHRSDAFYAFYVGPDGVGDSPVISRVGIENLHDHVGPGQMKISPDGRSIALGHLRDQAGRAVREVLVFGFDNQSGMVYNPKSIELAELEGWVYGLSFSPDSKRLYAADLRGNMYQLSLSDYGESAILASAIQLPGLEDYRFASLQLAPDGRIYVALPGTTQLGVIRYPNRPGLACELALSGIGLAEKVGSTRSVQFDLPNYMDHIFSSKADPCGLPLADFVHDSICEGQTAIFRDRSRNGPAEWHWFFEGGQPAEWIGPEPPPISFASPGEFTVKLEVRNSSGRDGIAQRITVRTAPALDAGSDARICRGDAVQLEAGGSGEFLWEPAAGLSAVDDARPLASPQRTTRYYVRLRDEYGCESRDSLVVHVDTIALRVSETQTVCPGGSVQLEATGGHRYEWSPPDGLDDHLSARPIASPQLSTEYTVTAYSENGCSTTATVAVVLVNASKADAGTDTTICAGDSLQLRGSGGTRYQWRPVEGLSNAASPAPVARPRRSTRYTLTVFNGPDCSSSASIFVSVLDLPELRLSGEQQICPGDSAQLRAEGGIRYEWEPREGLNNPAIPNPLAAPARTTLYRVTAYNAAGCSTSGTVRVLVGNFAQGGVRSSQATICRGESIQLEGFGGDSYEWSPSEGLSAVDIPNPVAAPLHSQLYTLRIRRGECTAEYTVNVKIEPRPLLTVGGDRRICAGESILLNAGGDIRYEWSPARGLSDPQSATPTAAPQETTLYTVQGWNAAGCVSSATLRVEVRPWGVAALSLPDTAVTPGEEILLPLALNVPEDYLPLRIERISFDLRYDARLVTLRGVEDAALLNRRLDGEEEVLSLERRDISLREARSTVLGLRVLGLISLATSSELSIENLELDFAPGTCLTVERRNGRFGIHDFCLGYGIRFATRLQMQVAPIPARDQVEVQIQAAQTGAVRLRLVNSFGRTVQESTTTAAEGQIRSINLVTTDLPAGLYYLLAEIGDQLQRAKLLIR